MTVKGDKRGVQEEGGYTLGSLLRVENEHGYEVIKPIAEGGMGSVLEVRDLRCDRSVAIKLALPGGEGEDAERAARFIKEAMITSQLQHPNIVPIHEVDVDTEGNHFYVMKLIQGTTLAAVLSRLRRHEKNALSEFPLSRLLAIFQKVCDAVAFAHSKGFIHRDLNPNNIMIGAFGEVMVLDWGLAFRMGESQEGSAPANADAFADEVNQGNIGDLQGVRIRTKAGVVMGTPSYMAPEQVLREMGSISPQTDIYALGGLLYSILTLRPPVVGNSSMDVLKKIVKGDLVSPKECDLLGASDAVEVEEEQGYAGGDSVGASAHCPDGKIPQALADITMKALSRDPMKRYQSVKSIQEEVEAFQSGLAWNLIVEEDFHDNTFLDRWEVAAGEYESGNGELCLSGGEPQVLVLRQDVPSDVRIDVECYEGAPYLNEIGCIIGGVRSGDAWAMSTSGYAFKLGAHNNKFNLLTRLNTKMWEAKASPLTAGSTCSVRFERTGARLRMFADGEEVFSIVDSDPLAGSQRTMIGLIGWVAETHYTRIRVYTLGLPWESDILDVAERQVEKGRYATAADLFRDTLDSMPGTERRARAEAGLKRAAGLKRLEDSLAEWQQQIENAWPGLGVVLQVDTGGLSVTIPPGAGIHDLVPLKGLPVTVLQCAKNDIADLEPLRGAPLVSLDCTGNPLRSLSPLTGMPLRTLLCSHCQIGDLGPLRGVPLARLNVAFNPLHTGLDALQGMSLEWLSCDRCGISSLEPLRGMQLVILFCNGNEIEDIEPLRGMPLGELSCAGNRIKSVDALHDMPLRNLHCHCNEIEDIESLSDLGLTILTCHNNRIRSLQPLSDMPLGLLICANNPVRHLGAFQRQAPHLFFYDANEMETQDMEWMRTQWSRDFRFDLHCKYLSVLLALRRNDVAALQELATEFRGHRYLFIPKFLSWDDASRLAEKLGGHLATIESADENTFISSLFPSWLAGVWGWIGLKTEANGPAWVTGAPLEFSAFRDELDARTLGPKVFCAGLWSYDAVPNASNAMFMEWDS